MFGHNGGDSPAQALQGGAGPSLRPRHETSGYIAQAPAPTPSGLGHHIENLSTQIDLAHKGLSALEQRLSPLLRSSPPSADGCGQASTCNESGVAGAIRELAARVGNLNYRLDDIYQRIDL